VFDHGKNGWREVAALKASDDNIGFATSVAISDDTVAASDQDYGQTSYNGRVYIFSDGKSGWRQAMELKPASAGDVGLGSALALVGRTLVVGANQALDQAGEIFVYTGTAAGWQQTSEIANPDTADGGTLGSSVAISGNIIVSGAPSQGNGGATYIYTERP
jgi:hypothetical protein